MLKLFFNFIFTLLLNNIYLSHDNSVSTALLFLQLEALLKRFEVSGRTLYGKMPMLNASKLQRIRTYVSQNFSNEWPNNTPVILQRKVLSNQFNIEQRSLRVTKISAIQCIHDLKNQTTLKGQPFRERAQGTYKESE